MNMTVTDLLTQPFTLILIAIIAFFAKDLIAQSKLGTTNQSAILILQQKIAQLEVGQLQTSSLALNIVKLEEQVKNLSENIKYLLTLIRKDHPDV